VYNLALRITMRNRFSDAQCGFKALRREVAQALLPHVADGGWFFDTELLVLAEHNGLRIHEVPVDWVDDPDSRVDIVATALADLRGMWQLTRRFARGEGRVALDRQPKADPLGTAGRFVGVGGMTTIIYLGLFLLLQIPLGMALANVAALTTSGIINYAAHRRYTFPAPDGPGGRRFAWASVGALAGGLLLSSMALGVVAEFSTGVFVALAALIAANAAVSVGRVVAIRAALLREHLDAMAKATPSRPGRDGHSVADLAGPDPGGGRARPPRRG
jgi:putative flippase GtrA